MKVYVLLLWFLEGDCELVDSFKGVFSSYDRAVKEKDDIDKMGCEIVSSIEAEEREYKHKMYGDPSYYEIRKCDVSGQSEQLCQHPFNKVVRCNNGVNYCSECDRCIIPHN